MAKTIPYISIKSVLYKISTILDEDMWNETNMLEWAAEGLRKVYMSPKLQENVSCIEIIEHTAKLPKDLVYLNQVAYRTDFSDIEEYKKQLAHTMNLEQETYNPEVLNYMQNPAGLVWRGISSHWYKSHSNLWKPMRPSTSSFMLSLECKNQGLNSHCDVEYTVDASLNITTTLKQGYVLVSYQAYPTEKDGTLLIPDDENLKSALFHYCLFMYWSKKALYKEEGSKSERDWHLKRYQILKTKASGALNSPDIGMMENIKNMRNRIGPNSNQFGSFFKGLGSPTSSKYL